MFLKSKYYDLDKDLLERANDAGLKTVLKLIPFGQTTTVICATVILFMFNHIIQVRFWNLLIVIAVIVTALIFSGEAYKDAHRYELLGPRTVLKYMILTGISAGLVSVQGIYLFNFSKGIEEVFLASFTVAMIAAGSFMLCTFIYMAWVWIILLGVAPIVIMIQQGSAQALFIIIPIIIYYALIAKNIISTSNLFIELKLKEEELKNALKLAEDATVTKSTFLANMSHEIRTPMNAVIGMAYLALKTELTEKQRDYVSKIHNAANSLLGIVNDILDFSKIESGKFEMESTDFVLEDVIKNSVGLISQAAYEKNLEILYHVPFKIPQNLIGDPFRLGQVITNIFSNAVKFTEKGQILIDIEIISTIRNKINLQFKIRDTGIGINKKELGKLFNAFTQADSSTTRKFGGTGLGLAISSKLVLMMGGSLWAESEVGIGSIFTFTAWFEKAYKEKLKSSVLPESINHMRILVVDDNNDAREICTEYLKAMSFITDSVSSGEEALLILKQTDIDKPYNVVFVDWKMDGINGIELAEKIQDRSYLSHIPAVVLVTAFDKEELIKQASHMKIDDFLVKPISQSMLYNSIVKIFSIGKEGSIKGQSKSENNYKLSGINILLVEDNEINQQIAMELLESQGVIVDIAANGVEAVTKIANMSVEMPYNIVLMDLQMPEMDGFEATTIIREKDKELPIIAMTARAMLEERKKCFDAGMNDHISKPIDPNILFSTISKWIPNVLRMYSPLKINDGNNLKINHIISSVIQIDGINVELGLKRVANNKKLYYSLLFQYSENSTGTVIKLWEAIKQNDFIGGERIAHNINGVSGNIGATKIQLLSSKLEELFRNLSNMNEIKLIMNELDLLINKISKNIKDSLSDRFDFKRNKIIIINDLQFLEYMQKLLGMLKDNDCEAVDFFERVKSKVIGRIDLDMLSKIAWHIKRFDYDEVILIIENILKHILDKEGEL